MVYGYLRVACRLTRCRWMFQVAPHECELCDHANAQSYEKEDALLHPPALYQSLVQSLGNTKALVDIRCIHDRILRCGLEQNLVLGNALLQVYGRCRSLHDVRACFDGLHQRNHISWNLVIRACARHGGLAEDAFELFKAMQRAGVAPTKFILASVLSSCCTQETLAEGRLIHALVASHGFESEVVVGTALVSMYGKCDSLEDAWKTFIDLPERNAVSWNVMIAVNAELGYAKDSLKLFKEMQQQAVTLEKVTFLHACSACASVSNVAEAKQMHARIAGSEFDSDVMVRTTLIKMYGQLDHIHDAQRMFDKMPEKDLVSWNALIAAYAQQGLGEVALQVFQEMQLKRLRPNKVTLISILDACAGQLAVMIGKTIHDLIVGTGLELDVVLGTALVNMYGKCGSLEDAQRVFNGMPERNVVSWNAMKAVYVQSGDGKEVLHLFELMQQDGTFPDNVTFLNVLDACAIQSALAKGKGMHARIIASGLDLDVVLGSSLINMYGKCGDLRGARMVFDRMTEHNAITFVNLLSVCANLGALGEGKRLHAFIVESGVELDVVLNTALVNMYGKCGMLDTAWNIFHNMPKKNTLSWNAMIASYTQQGQGKQALEMFEMMRQGEILPDEATFVSVLSACSHAGLVDEGCCCFTLMDIFYGLTPIVDHYNCFIDMLGRAGRLNEAENLIKSMPVSPTEVSWATLLGACQSQINVEQGEEAASYLFRLDPQNPVAYVTLAKVYAAAGMEDDAARVLPSMKEKVWKTQLDCSTSQLSACVFTG